MRAATVRKTAKAKAKRRRRVRWNHALGPWGNGFDAGWRDAHRRVNFGVPWAAGFRARGTRRRSACTRRATVRRAAPSTARPK